MVFNLVEIFNEYYVRYNIKVLLKMIYEFVLELISIICFIFSDKKK